MVLRLNGRSKELFWGCTRFPNCRCTLRCRRNDSSPLQANHQGSFELLEACRRVGISCHQDSSPGEMKALLEGKLAYSAQASIPSTPEQSLASEEAFERMTLDEKISRIMSRVRDWGTHRLRGLKTVSVVALGQLSFRALPMCFRDLNQGMYPDIRTHRSRH